MKYRIIEKNKIFYPQYKSWGRWRNFRYQKVFDECIGNFSYWFDAFYEAKDFIENERTKNTSKVVWYSEENFDD